MRGYQCEIEANPGGLSVEKHIYGGHRVRRVSGGAFGFDSSLAQQHERDDERHYQDS